MHEGNYKHSLAAVWRFKTCMHRQTAILMKVYACFQHCRPSKEHMPADSILDKTRQAIGRLARQRTGCVDDAMCPIGIPKTLKFNNIITHWVLSGVAIQQILHLHAVQLTRLGPTALEGRLNGWKQPFMMLCIRVNVEE